MGVYISDYRTPANTLKCNWWHWRSTVEIIRSANLLENEDCDMLSSGFGEISLENGAKIITFLEGTVLPNLSDEERILLDGKKTVASDDGIFHKEDVSKNYSTDSSWLKKFVAFLKASGEVYVS